MRNSFAHVIQQKRQPLSVRNEPVREFEQSFIGDIDSRLMGPALGLNVETFQLDQESNELYLDQGGNHNGLIDRYNVYCYGGDDFVYVSSSVLSYVDGGAGQDTLYGGSGVDTLLGGSGDDRLYGHDGDDVIYAGDGNDTITGDRGHDVLYGGKGHNIFYSHYDSDTIYIVGDKMHDTVHDFDHVGDRVIVTNYHRHQLSIGYLEKSGINRFELH